MISRVYKSNILHLPDIELIVEPGHQVVRYIQWHLHATVGSDCQTRLIKLTRGMTFISNKTIDIITTRPCSCYLNTFCLNVYNILLYYYIIGYPECTA